MKVRLLRDSRINHAAGDTVDVSPETAHFLVSVGSAIVVETATRKVAEVAEKAVKAPKEVTKTAPKRTKK